MAGSSKEKHGNGTGNGDGGGQYAPGDIVLGKIKGYPPWPGVLCDEDNVPKQNVLSARPGKNYHIVRFFPAADYGFNRSHELRKLTKREIEAFLSDPHKRAAELRAAYKLALDPEAWNEEQNEAVRQAEEDADEEEDMLAGEEEEEEEEEHQQPVKKRKSGSSSNAARKSNASSSNKKPKVETASPRSRSTSATAAAQSAKEKKQSTAASAGTSASPQKGTPAGDGEADEAELDPETKRVKQWRYALQHAFLPRSGQINAEEMQRHDETFKQVEEYRHITPNQLRLTKIGKVMKRVVQLSDVPRDEEFHFRQRAQKLCDIWGEVIAGVGSSKPKSEQSSHATATASDSATVAAAAAASAASPSKPSNGLLEETTKPAESLSAPAAAAKNDDSITTERPQEETSTATTAVNQKSKIDETEEGAEPPEKSITSAHPQGASAADESVLSQPPEKVSGDESVAAN